MGASRKEEGKKRRENEEKPIENLMGEKGNWMEKCATDSIGGGGGGMRDEEYL